LSLVPPAQLIRKTRHLLPVPRGLIWSIDQFEGANVGLVIAEVELVHSRQLIEIPFWVGEEITHNPRYGNSMLARYPVTDPTIKSSTGLRTASAALSASDPLPQLALT